jgi:hypothetical protein
MKATLESPLTYSRFVFGHATVTTRKYVIFSDDYFVAD